LLTAEILNKKKTATFYHYGVPNPGTVKFEHGLQFQIKRMSGDLRPFSVYQYKII
jgi:hypothetical protein